MRRKTNTTVSVVSNGREEKFAGTLIKRETIGSVYGEITTSTYSQNELRGLIIKFWPHYVENTSGGDEK